MKNLVILIGNLGKDPEVKELQSGKVCNFSIATTRKWKDKSGNKAEETEWHNVSAFGSLATICGHYLRKGSKVYIEGRIHTRKWEDKEGRTQYSTSIIAEDLKMLDSKSPEASAVPVIQSPRNPHDGVSDPDDLPF